MDEIAKAYATLSSLKLNVPSTFEVEQSWVEDFHSALDKIEKNTGESLGEFRVPRRELHEEVSGGNYMTGQVHYSGRRVMERTRFLSKLDAVLGYFRHQLDKSTKGTIVFNKD